MRVSIEAFSQCSGEIVAAARAHWAEIGPHRHLLPVDPDLACYAALSQLHMLTLVTVREGARLVGYTIFIVSPHMHSRLIKWACCDGIWLNPSARRPRVAMRMIQVAEDSLRNQGVVRIMISEHPDHPVLGRLLKHMGYEPEMVGYARSL